MANIKIVEVRSEIAAGTRGASMGIDALKVASLDLKSEFFRRYETVNVADENEKLFEENPFPWAKHIDGVYTMVQRVNDHISQVLVEGQKPVVLAGDHSTAAGTICGIKSAYPEKRLGVIWIDAHGDLHTPYTTPSGNMHGMPLAMVLGIDNREEQVNSPKPETVEYWEKIKAVGVAGPKVKPKDIVFIGVRDTENPENALMQQHGMRNFTVSEVRQKGVEQIVVEALKELDAVDIIYVSFDVDSMDTTVSQGTGTPVPDGLTESEAGELNRLLVQNPKVVCWEVVEVNPTLDSENRMAEVAFSILETTTQAMESR